MTASLLSSEFTQALAARITTIRKMPPPIPKQDRQTENLTRVGVNGFLAVGGKTYLVTDKARWGAERDGSTELTLFCLNDGSSVFLEWWQDISLHVQVSKTRLTLRDIGLAPRNIEEIDETTELSWNGNTYCYDDDLDLEYHKDGQESETPHIYVFKTKDGQRSLSVQVWDDGDRYDVWASEMLDPDMVEVLNLGNGAPR